MAAGHAGDIESLKQHVNDLEAECASNEFEEALGHEADADGEEQVGCGFEFGFSTVLMHFTDVQQPARSRTIPHQPAPTIWLTPPSR